MSEIILTSTVKISTDTDQTTNQNFNDIPNFFISQVRYLILENKF